jgi:hypothetical protein
LDKLGKSQSAAFRIDPALYRYPDDSFGDLERSLDGSRLLGWGQSLEAAVARGWCIPRWRKEAEVSCMMLARGVRGAAWWAAKVPPTLRRVGLWGARRKRQKFFGSFFQKRTFLPP